MNRIINTLALILATFGLIIECLPDIHFEIELELLMFIIPGIIVLLNMVYQLKHASVREEKGIIIKLSFTYLFFIYILAIISLLFLNNSYRLPYITKNHNLPLFSPENIEKNTSIVPFKFMLDMISRYTNSMIGIKTLIYNILGNLLLFAPMGIFIPILFKTKIKNLKSYVLLIFIISLSTELMQFFLKLGQADIDDIILNLIGAVIVYVIYNKLKKKAE